MYGRSSHIFAFGEAVLAVLAWDGSSGAMFDKFDKALQRHPELEDALLDLVPMVSGAIFEAFGDRPHESAESVDAGAPCRARSVRHAPGDVC